MFQCSGFTLRTEGRKSPPLDRPPRRGRLDSSPFGVVFGETELAMAVLIEALSVVIKATTVVERYPGGWEAFEADPPNRTLCADGELIRVGFMTPDDVEAFEDALAIHGIKYQEDGKAVDLVVADQQSGLLVPCDWAECWRGPLGGDNHKMFMGCRLTGSKIQELVTPDGWDYDSSLSAEFKSVETGRVSELLEFLRHENGLDVYRGPRDWEGKIRGAVRRAPA